MSILEVSGLTKSYRDGEKSIRVLDNISFKLEKQGFASIRGASGAGKSTFLNMIAALDLPDSGEIKVDSVTLQSYAERDSLHLYRRHKIGLVFQNHYLMPDFSALENVMFPLLIQGRQKKEAAAAAREALNSVGLAERTGHYPDQISGGESQRIAVARAIVHRPPLILADEPTGNLDDRNTMHFIDMLASLQNEHGLTVLVVTHEPHLAEAAPLRYTLEDSQLVQLN